LIPLVFGLAFLSFFAGCGRCAAGCADVGGQVCLDGSPLETGSIPFMSSEDAWGIVAGG
jgi:hypothetical protein